MEDPGLKAATPPRVIFHVDLNAFYPSVEVVHSPALKGRPVIVGADPKGGRGRGVVVSCSYEARKLGVRSGMPISRAFSLAPEALYLRPNFPLYGKVSKRVMELVQDIRGQIRAGQYRRSLPGCQRPSGG